MLQTAATSFKREKPLGEQAAQLRHYSYLTERWRERGGGGRAGGGIERERGECGRGLRERGVREGERNRRWWGERGQKEMGGGGGGDERSVGRE